MICDTKKELAAGMLATARGLAGFRVEGSGVESLHRARAFGDAARLLDSAGASRLARAALAAEAWFESDHEGFAFDPRVFATAISISGEPPNAALARWVILGDGRLSERLVSVSFLFAARAEELARGALDAESRRIHRQSADHARRAAPVLRELAATRAVEAARFAATARVSIRAMFDYAGDGAASQEARRNLELASALCAVVEMRPDEARLIVEASKAGKPYDAAGRAAAAALRAAREEAAAAALAAEEAEL